jgi:hypothetical protein
MTTDVFESDLREALARRAAEVPETAADRLRHGNYRPRAHGRSGGVAAAGLAVALAAGVTAAVLPSHGQAPAGQATLDVQLLADRAASAALSGPDIKPGQWVYRQVMYKDGAPVAGASGSGTESMWFTAAGKQGFVNGWPPEELGLSPAVSYADLRKLPTKPAALEKYLADMKISDSSADVLIGGTYGGFGFSIKGGPSDAGRVSAFAQLSMMLWAYAMPPKLTAEIFHALADVPGVKVDTHATDEDGRPGVAFVLQAADRYPIRMELVLNASDYRLMGLQWWQIGPEPGEPSNYAMPLVQLAILRTAFFSRLGDVP